MAATFMQGAILIGDEGEAEDAGSRADGLRTWDWRAARHAFSAFCVGATRLQLVAAGGGGLQDRTGLAD